MTPDTSPAGDGRIWIDGTHAIRDYIAERLEPHGLTFGVHKVRDLLDLLLDPPRSLDAGLASRVAIGRPGAGHSQAKSVERSLLDELLAGDQPGLAERAKLPPLPRSNVVSLRPEEDGDAVAVDERRLAEALAEAEAERDRLRECVEALAKEVAALREALGEQARAHAAVVAVLSKPSG